MDQASIFQSPILQQLRQQVDNLESVPYGLVHLLVHCLSLYPQQKPAAVYQSEVSMIKQQGTDPLEYIYVFKNDAEVPHWHYIGFGLSDFYGYSAYCLQEEKKRSKDPDYMNKFSTPLPQLYPPLDPDSKCMSGYGFELTMRVKCESYDEPPAWPGQLMQQLARYVFATKNVINSGDHVNWNRALDNSESHIRHMLMTDDIQLPPLMTELASVKFIQIVGVFLEELVAGREWTVNGILSLMRKHQETGGDLLITDMCREENLFQIVPTTRATVDDSIRRVGSDLCQISTWHKFSSIGFSDEEKEQQINQTDVCERTPSRMSCGSQSMMRIENAELAPIFKLENVYLTINRETARVLPVALAGRLAHGRIFAFQSPKGDLNTLFVPQELRSSTLVAEDNFVKQGPCLHLYISKSLREAMQMDIGHYGGFENAIDTPIELSWPEYGLHIKIVEQRQKH